MGRPLPSVTSPLTSSSRELLDNASQALNLMAQIIEQQGGGDVKGLLRKSIELNLSVHGTMTGEHFAASAENSGFHASG